MIEELKPKICCGTEAPPDSWEIMKKINEIILQVNTLILDTQIRYIKEERNDQKTRHDDR